MEVGQISSLLASIASIAGSGWLGISASAVLIILFLVAWIYLKNVAAEQAYRESKENEIRDQIKNREESAKIEEQMEKSEIAIQEKRSENSVEKKKRTWLF